ncbi:MAG: hypothetical protein ACKPKO_00390, partial [Candidatus Fonsibacter sp.]
VARPALGFIMNATTACMPFIFNSAFTSVLWAQSPYGSLQDKCLLQFHARNAQLSGATLLAGSWYGNGLRCQPTVRFCKNQFCGKVWHNKLAWQLPDWK